MPSCGACTQDTMKAFQGFTSNRQSALASVYSSAAQQVDVSCGPTFVNTSLAATATSGGPGRIGVGGSVGTGVLALVVLLSSLLL